LIKINIGKVNKLFLFLGICIFLLLIFTNNILAAEKQPILRIGIFLNQNEVNISGDGIYEIYNLKSDRIISKGNKKIIKILPHKKGIEISGEGVYSGPIKIIPVGKTKIIVIISGQKYRYRGSIEVDIDKEHKKLNIINIIGIEEYLYGVMKKEISPHWPLEALKAQAIAARTFAIFNMYKYINKGYNLDASTNSQAYGGVNHEDPLTNRAVDLTRGVIMVYQKEPINAVYHSDSGGYTEDSETVWGSYEPYLRSVKSKFEELVSPPHHSWTYSIAEKDLVKKLQKQGYKIDSILSIKLVKKDNNSRVNELGFISKNNGIIYIKANDFRKIIGSGIIRSTLFNVNIIGKKLNDEEEIKVKEEDKEEPKKSVKDLLNQKKDWTIKELIELMKQRREDKKKEEDAKKIEIRSLNIPLTFSFSGSGNGHGVGMSQWGAYGMALQGYGYQDILKYYYQGINIIKKY
jgi:stage II sporulation protein D